MCSALYESANPEMNKGYRPRWGSTETEGIQIQGFNNSELEEKKLPAALGLSLSLSWVFMHSVLVMDYNIPAMSGLF